MSKKYAYNRNSSLLQTMKLNLVTHGSRENQVKWKKTDAEIIYQVDVIHICVLPCDIWTNVEKHSSGHFSSTNRSFCLKNDFIMNYSIHAKKNICLKEGSLMAYIRAESTDLIIKASMKRYAQKL